MTSREKPQITKAVPIRVSRVGKRVVGGHFDPVVAQTLRILAAQKDTTIQLILAEAINDYFQKNGYERLVDETSLPRGAAAHKK